MSLPCQLSWPRPALGASLWWAAFTLLVIAACGPAADPFEEHMQRELRFFHAGVDMDGEVRAVTASLRQAGMHIVAERSGPGFHALGAASARFAKTAVRIITARGVGAAEDAERDDVLQPGRVHLLEDLPSEVGAVSLVGWVWIAEGDTAGCARIQRIDPGGYVRPMQTLVAVFGSGACVGSLTTRAGLLWGTVVWPSLGMAQTPAILVPLELVTRALDDPRPPNRIRMRDAEGWIEPEHAARVQELAAREDFTDRHSIAFELAALAHAAGKNLANQRATYTTHAGSPDTPEGRILWRRAVALIEGGWEEHPDAEGGSGLPPESPGRDPMLQSADHGQEAQKEADDAR